jgi:hypothetical protein
MLSDILNQVVNKAYRNVVRAAKIAGLRYFPYFSDSSGIPQTNPPVQPSTRFPRWNIQLTSSS